jgi:hypothetical protein
MCSRCLGEEFSGSLNEGSSLDARQWTDNNGAQSRSGSIAEDPKFDGASSDDMKYEGDKSNSGNNPNIGHTGWGS